MGEDTLMNDSSYTESVLHQIELAISWFKLFGGADKELSISLGQEAYNEMFLEVSNNGKVQPLLGASLQYEHAPGEWYILKLDKSLAPHEVASVTTVKWVRLWHKVTCYARMYGPLVVKALVWSFVLGCGLATLVAAPISSAIVLVALVNWYIRNHEAN